MADVGLDDIEIPELEITAGWLVSDVKTLQDCDDAHAYLTGACAGIECQISMEEVKIPSQQRPEWLARTKAALRFKKGALAVVSTRRGAINRQSEIDRQDRYNEQLLAFARDALGPERWMQIVTAFTAGRVDRAA
jgi:hypothetical protein